MTRASLLLAIVPALIAGADDPPPYLHPARDVDPAALESDDRVSVAETDSAWILAPNADPRPGSLIFFPGGLVDPVAYAPLVREVAGRGHRVFLVKMPPGLALPAASKRRGVALAREVREAHPDAAPFVVAGHSLGAAIAAEAVRERPDDFAGLVLIGTTHPRDFDLSEYPGVVAKLVATEDRVAPLDKVERNRHLLPPSTRWVRIEGGNHAQFGSYGAQPGDGEATISREAQRALTASAILATLRRAAPESSEAPPADDPDWRTELERGRARAKARDWQAAESAFTEAIRLAPRQVEPWIARGNARGELSRFADARADFARAADVDPDNPEPRYRIALASIALDDDETYRKTCRDLLARFGDTDDPAVASPLAYTGAARPNSLDDPAALVRWGERAVPLFRGNERVLGATLHRAGRSAEAVQRFDESSALTTPVAWDWLFLAMAHHRLNHTDEARAYFDRAERWIDAAEADRARPPAVDAPRTSWHSWNERAEVLALRREARHLLQR